MGALTPSQTRTALAHRLLVNAARTVAKKRARKARNTVAPRGMRGSGLPFARNANGTPALDPVSLNHIPKSRAVKVGKHLFDARTLRELFARNADALNPLTRQPFPAHILNAHAPPLAMLHRFIVDAALLLRMHDKYISRQQFYSGVRAAHIKNLYRKYKKHVYVGMHSQGVHFLFGYAHVYIDFFGEEAPTGYIPRLVVFTTRGRTEDDMAISKEKDMWILTFVGVGEDPFVYEAMVDAMFQVKHADERVAQRGGFAGRLQPL